MCSVKPSRFCPSLFPPNPLHFAGKLIHDPYPVEQIPNRYVRLSRLSRPDLSLYRDLRSGRAGGAAAGTDGRRRHNQSSRARTNCFSLPPPSPTGGRETNRAARGRRRPQLRSSSAAPVTGHLRRPLHLRLLYTGTCPYSSPSSTHRF
jgi:hypothetical protein